MFSCYITEFFMNNVLTFPLDNLELNSHQKLIFSLLANVQPSPLQTLYEYIHKTPDHDTLRVFVDIESVKKNV